MRLIVFLIATIFVGVLCAASVLADFRQSPLHSTSSALFDGHRRKIAIIGAGPSGTSAAYWLSKAQEQLNSVGRGSEGFDLHLYEKENRVGGRTKVIHPFDDDKLYEPVELGASIFADVNRNMVRFAKLFNLPASAKLGESDATTAIWDGKDFLLDDLSGNWWSSAKIFWRYGYSPITVSNVVSDLTKKFLQLYDPKFLHDIKAKNDNKTNSTTKSGYPWDSIESLADELDFSAPASTDADTWFYGKGVSRLFIREVIEAATRVNYAQNTEQIHGLGGGVSLAATGAAGIKGGNFRVFQEMLDRSGATLHSGDHGEVTGIVKFKSRQDAIASGKISSSQDVWPASVQGPKWWVGTSAGTGGLYDAVLIGAPWHSSGITLMGTESVIPINKYVHLYVTLVATNASHPDPTYFGRGKGSAIAKTIMTSYNAVRTQSNHGGGGGGGSDDDDDQILNVDSGISNKMALEEDGGKWYWLYDLARLFGRSSDHRQRPFASPSKAPKLDFLSLNYISNLGPRRTDSSPPSVNARDDHLVKIFSLEPLSDVQLEQIIGQDSIGWIHRQEWDSYPELHPTRTFPPIRPDQGLYYINAMEPLVSTMETSTVASRNAVALLLEHWYGLEFITGSNCNFEAFTADNDVREGWDGWGCNAA
ncbi:unnamed protein product [Sympodiomycopsis kandeliae]